MSAAVVALISNTSAVKIEASPDVWGPNGSNYNNNDARYDVGLIGIDVTTQAKAGTPTCAPGDWATVHYKASLDNGLVVANSREEPTGLPRDFILGASEVFKCWDLAVQKLHEGDSATL